MKNNIDIEKEVGLLMNVYKLKFTYRLSERTINGHKETVGAHTWSMMILVDMFLDKLSKLAPNKYNLDKLKIYEYIIYHDLVEAETGDIDLDPRDISRHSTKAENEEKAFNSMLLKIPTELIGPFKENFTKYEKKEDLESKFVKLIDVLECEFQCFFNKDLFVNWTEEYFISKREKHFNAFPELKYIYYSVLDYYKKNDYFKVKEE